MASLPQLADSSEGLETTDHEECLNIVFVKDLGNTLKASSLISGQTTVGADLRTTPTNPALGIQPVDLADGAQRLIGVVATKTRETIIEGDGSVAAG